MQKNCDYLIIGAGVVGISTALSLKKKYHGAKIVIIDKESEVAFHSSGRNSGVLHAGFYYTENSLKAKFTKEGCKRLTLLCKENDLKINQCGKVVITKDESELEGLKELKRRGDINGIETHIVDTEELKEIEPNAKTYEQALYSPTTATINPKEVMIFLKKEAETLGIDFYFDCGYKARKLKNQISTTSGMVFTYKTVINGAGLYADKIAKDFNCSKNYTIIPFKGLYLKYTGADKPVKTNIYPVPNLNNPFLGVHYTVTVDKDVKIGPTAIPAFWRENYSGFSRFKGQEFFQILKHEANLYRKNNFNFRSLAHEEMKKYNKAHLGKLAEDMVKNIDFKKFDKWSKPGIRAQLLNLSTGELVQDFVIENEENSIHILNAVSPAFTCSLPFADWIVEKYL